MASTTISLDPVTRERLAAEAARHGRSLGDEVDALLREREVREILSTCAKLTANPANADLVRASVAPPILWARD